MLKKRVNSTGSNKNADGQAAVEFAVIVPLVLIIISVVVEFTFLFVEWEKASSLSREIGKVVFYECGGRLEDSLTSCLDKSLEDVFQGANQMLKDFSTQGKLISTVYEFDSTVIGGGTPTVRTSRTRGTIPPTSHFDGNSFSAGGNYQPQSLSSENRTIIVGEVFYRHTAKTPIGAFFSALFPEYYYEVTIF